MSDNAGIALIHALGESAAPIRAAFVRLWPKATTADLPDASLSAELAAAGPNLAFALPEGSGPMPNPPTEERRS